MRPQEFDPEFDAVLVPVDSESDGKFLVLYEKNPNAADHKTESFVCGHNLVIENYA